MKEHAKHRRLLYTALLYSLGALFGAAAVAAVSLGAQDAAKLSITVTVLGRGKKEAPALARQDVMVFQDRERRPVLDWTPIQANQANLDLAILMDDSLDSNIGVQFRDIANFIRSLPPATRVSVVYGTHGNASVRQRFTSDHHLAAKALRLPVGRSNESSSIYLSLADLLKHWPAGSLNSNRHAVLVISDGLDLYRGVVDSQPPLNPDLRKAVDTAQREGVTIYTLFANDAGLYRDNSFLINNGQGSLSLLAEETGGEAFFQGLQTPVSFQPFLQRLGNLLEHQYVLTFEAQSGRMPAYARLRVATEQPGVKILAPARVYVPAVRG